MRLFSMTVPTVAFSDAIRACRLLHLELDAGLGYGPEARHLDLDSVRTGLQCGKVVDARFVAHGRARGIGSGVRHRDGRAGDNGAAAVADHSRDLAQRLGGRARCDAEQGRGDEDDATPHKLPHRFLLLNESSGKLSARLKRV